MHRMFWSAFAVALALAPAAYAQDAVTAPTAAAAPVETTAPAAVSAPAFPTYAAACELGFSLAEGNTSNRTATGGCTAARTGEVWLVGFTGKVRFGQSRFGGPKYPGGLDQPRGDFLETENNFDVALREERSLTESKNQYLFAVEGLAGDRFKGYWQRIDAELGYGYAFWNRDDAALKLELGGQYNRDFLVSPDPDGALEVDRYGGVLTLLGRKTLNEAVLVEGKVSYMPNLKVPKTDYRATGDLALSAKLSDKLAFKSAAGLAYNNLPPMVTPLDKAGAKIAGVADVPARSTDVNWNNVLVVSIF